MVARLEVSDGLADLLDDSGRLVAEHGGHRMRVEAFDEVQVTMTYARRRRADQDLVVPRFVDVNLFDR